MDSSKAFFLGRKVDPAIGKATPENLYYDPADLTTHGVVTGMTGSGKTGLCIGLLEEAALQKVPAIIIDPKGDLTNLLLHFPSQQPADFEPWVDPDAARKAGKNQAEFASETARSWSEGQAGWGIDAGRITALQQSVKFCVYTPGSDAGVPVSILANLKAPEGELEGSALMEKITSTVSALLGLVGVSDIDPVRSREHILLTNIFQYAWSQGKDLDLSELILQTQTPPFDKLGVFPLDKFFPQKERDTLAMQLNNFLASPAFEVWMSGEGLDIAKMLYSSDGTPRHSIFYIAHLTDTERMFFVTLLYSSIEAWMRQQSGTSGLRAMVYFDEIMGYLPPLQNPPSKMVILRMLKQARAFGVGLLLATQNPVDVDYKALSNAGTWFIGKLQTDQDKQRLLDGLEGVAGGMDRAKFDKLISSLGKRVFLLHNVHESAPVTMQTRWTMNYLAGPLTRAQIPALNQLAGIGSTNAAKKKANGSVSSGRSTASSNKGGGDIFSDTRPAVPAGLEEYILQSNLSPAESATATGTPLPVNGKTPRVVYRPALIGLASIRYLDRRYNLDHVLRKCLLVREPDKRGMIHWEEHVTGSIDQKLLTARGVEGAEYAALDLPLADAKLMAAMRKDLGAWLFQTGELRLLSNAALKLTAAPGITENEFAAQCASQSELALKKELATLADTQRKKTAVLKERLAREERELAMDQSNLNQRTIEEVGSGLNTVLGMLGGRKRSISSNLTKRRMTATAKASVDESVQTIEALRKQIADLEAGMAQEEMAVRDKWQTAAKEITSMAILPQKANIFLDAFGVVWLPYYLIGSSDPQVELPAFKL